MQTGEAEKDEVLDSEQEAEIQEDPPQGEEHEEEGEAGEVAESDDAGGEEETVVSIGEEEPPTSEASEADSSVIADLRRRYRETSRELQRLRTQQASGQPQPQAVPQLRKKPTLEEHDFDAEKYDADLDKWYAEKAKVEKETEAREAAHKQAVEAQQKAAQAVQERYAKSRAELKVKDFQEAEDEVVSHLSDWQQGIAAKVQKPAQLVYALGKNPKKLAELASIKDPVEFAFAVADLRKEIKVTTRKATNKPAPEAGVRGGIGAGSGGTSKATLERLHAEAEKTGDRTKVAAYLRQQRQAGK